MALNRDRKEELREQQIKRMNDDKLQLVKAQMEEKTRFGNLVRFMNKQKKEFDDEQQIQRQKEQASLNEHQHEQENNLARELDNVKREEVRQLKLRYVQTMDLLYKRIRDDITFFEAKTNHSKRHCKHNL